MKFDRGSPPVPGTHDLVEVDHPTENAFNWLAHRQLNNALTMAAREHARGRLVDIGCGLKPYAELFAPFVDEHVGVDHPDSPHASTAVDVLATAYEVPLRAGSFDTALLSEVLEHLEAPDAALAEVFRLLDTNGKLLLTTPFVWTLHEAPRDFFRFSPHGLRHLLAEAGFVDIEVTPLSGQWSTIALLMAYALRASPASRWPRPLEVVARGGQALGARMDTASFKPWLSWNHLAVARKP